MLETLVRRRRQTRICECRRCGAAVDSAESDCPYCGQTEIVTYDLP